MFPYCTSYLRVKRKAIWRGCVSEISYICIWVSKRHSTLSDTSTPLFLSSYWTSFRFLSCMAFLIPSIHGVNEILFYIPYILSIWIKFCTENIHLMSLNRLLFRQNLALFTRVKDFLSFLSAFLDGSGKNLAYEISKFSL